MDEDQLILLAVLVALLQVVVQLLGVIKAALEWRTAKRKEIENKHSPSEADQRKKKGSNRSNRLKPRRRK